MEIKYQGILLRDMRESDIADDIRRNTVETARALRDAPREMEEELRRFDPAAYRQKEPGFRECHRKAGVRSVRGGTCDGLTFRPDKAAFRAYCRSGPSLPPAPEPPRRRRRAG